MASTDALNAAQRPDIAGHLGGATRRPRRPLWGLTLFATLSTSYFLVGTLLVLRYNLFDPDGPSRVANAAFTTMSRDPHLSAIGFVWNPLPSLVQIPILALSHWWPELRTEGIAGVVQSSLFMAASALIVRQIAIDHSIPKVWRWLAVACFSLNPIIVVYGSSGMSEASEIFCTLWATQYCLQWVRSRKVGDLAWTGIALGVGYLTRYEIAFAVVGAAIFVGLVVACSSRPFTLNSHVISTVAIVAFPFCVAFTVWALSGWVLTGDLFATFSSQYGNSSQIRTASSRGSNLGRIANTEVNVIAARLMATQPLIVLTLAASIAITIYRRNALTLVPISIMGPILLFATWGQFTGTTFGWFRFYIMAIPLVIVSAILFWPECRQERTRRIGLPSAAALGAVWLILSTFVTPVVTARAMLDEGIGNQHMQFGFRSLLSPEQYPPHEQWYRRLRTDDRLIANYFDRMELPEGKVLMDTFAGWGIWLASENPRQFVITSDYDFVTALNRPWDKGIRFIIVSNPALNDASDAINERYPRLWAEGMPFTRLRLSVDGPTRHERWRIYEVIRPKRPD